MIHVSLYEDFVLCERCLGCLEFQPQLTMLSLSLFSLTHVSLTLRITNQACMFLDCYLNFLNKILARNKKFGDYCLNIL